jgi:hypothetical protein
MVVSDVFDPALRSRSFEIIADVAGLRGGPEAGVSATAISPA